tara:strand:- start:2787 stop:3290 length:504 start_codon:yes stop_codon:yes gene_type:complete
MDVTTNLKEYIYNLEISDYSVSKLDEKQYHEILSACAMLGEMRACVFVYDHMLSKKIKPTTETINILQKVHSKTVVENDTLLRHSRDTSKLLPRRRIHKIVKGANYSENYNEACDKYLGSIKEFLETDVSLKQLHKNKLIPRISTELSIPERHVRYVVTKLKRTKYL